MPLSRSSRIVFAIIVLSAMHGSIGVAQFPPSFDLGDPVAHQKKVFDGQMAVQMAELDRVCDLSAQQKSKLQTASKGAILRAMKLWKKEALAAQDRFGGMAGARLFGNNEEEDQEDDKEADEEEIKPQTLITLLSMGIQTDPSKIIFWTRTVKTVLTEEQKTKLADAGKARRKFRRELGVRQKVEELDQQLRFTPEQRQKVMDIVDRVLGGTMEIEQDGGLGGISIADFPELSPSHLEPALGPEQLKVFRQSVAEQENPLAEIRRTVRARRLQPSRMQGMTGSTYVGIALGTTTLNMNETKVDFVLPGGPAEKAGLQTGDTLVSVAGTAIRSPTRLFSITSRKSPGDKLEVVVKRDGKEHKLELVLDKKIE